MRPDQVSLLVMLFKTPISGTTNPAESNKMAGPVIVTALSRPCLGPLPAQNVADSGFSYHSETSKIENSPMSGV